MEAKCPHCGSVFETARTGPQFCPNCGQQVNVSNVPPPPEGPETPRQTAADQETPWERRKELGLWKGFFGTWKSSLLAPETFWNSVRPTGKMGDALFYSWIIQIAARVLSLPFVYLQRNTSREILERFRDQIPEQYMSIVEWLTKGTFLITIVVTPAVLWPLALVISAAITHLFCLIFGAHKHGFEATFRVICYSSAPIIFGFHTYTQLLAYIYAAVLAVFGIAKLQETTTGRAIGIVVAPYAVCTCCFCISIFGVASLVAKGVMSNM